MNRNFRHRLLQWLMWSRISFPLVRLVNAFIRRWNYVIMNRSLHSDTNGEYWLVQQLPANATVVDVGFNLGDFTETVLKSNASARVLGFDPARPIARHYAEKFSAERRLQFHPLALSDRPGRALFHDADNMSSSLAPGRSPNEHAYEVEITTLDDFARAHALQTIHLLKIDAEGFDLNVLEGSRQLMQAQRIEMFLFEYADGWINNRRFLREAADFIESQPYKLYRLFNGFLVPFHYSCAEERHDLGCMFVGVSRQLMDRAPLRAWGFPG
jgi:FkbM family methyltransferase